MLQLRRSYILRFRGEDTRVTVVRNSSGDVWVETESGERIEDALVLDGGRTVSIRRDGRMYLVDLTTPDIPETRALVDGKGGVVEILDELTAAAGDVASSGGGSNELRAAMPGLVVALKAELGDEVDEGQSLVVLEAMKMQNELPSPRAGKVVEICCKVGQSVETDAVLVRLEDSDA